MANGQQTETVSLRLPSGESVQAIVPSGMADEQIQQLMRTKHPEFFAGQQTERQQIEQPPADFRTTVPKPLIPTQPSGRYAPWEESKEAYQDPDKITQAAQLAGGGEGIQQVGKAAIEGIGGIASPRTAALARTAGQEAISHIPILGRVVRRPSFGDWMEAWRTPIPRTEPNPTGFGMPKTVEGGPGPGQVPTREEFTQPGPARPEPAWRQQGQPPPTTIPVTQTPVPQELGIGMPRRVAGGPGPGEVPTREDFERGFGQGPIRGEPRAIEQGGGLQETRVPSGQGPARRAGPQPEPQPARVPIWQRPVETEPSAEPSAQPQPAKTEPPAKPKETKVKHTIEYTVPPRESYMSPEETSAQDAINTFIDQRLKGPAPSARRPSPSSGAAGKPPAGTMSWEDYMRSKGGK